jgi:hypothetical protein
MVTYSSTNDMVGTPLCNAHDWVIRLDVEYRSSRPCCVLWVVKEGLEEEEVVGDQLQGSILVTSTINNIFSLYILSSIYLTNTNQMRQPL